MGQGPEPCFLFIGNGRVSRHLRRYFGALNLAFRVWTRASEQPLRNALPGCSHVLLAISDDAIQPFLEEHGELLEGLTLIHFSGSLSLPPLRDSQARSSVPPVGGLWGAHPLMTFPNHLYPLAEYASIPFIVDADAPDFARLLPGVPNPCHRLDRRHKSLYHALCVLSGNFTTILWNRFFQTLEEQFGIPREAGLPYLRRIALNLEEADNPLTGPLARRDFGTIERNLQALEGDPFQAIYSSFVQAVAR